MNDVLVQYTYQKVFNIYNEILSESFTFKTLYNKYTVFTNGLGFTLSNAGNAQSTEYLIKKEGEKGFTVASGTDKFTRESNAIILTDNVKTNPNAEYKVTFKYGDKNSNKKQETSIDAFIYRPSKEGNRLEIHCPMQNRLPKSTLLSLDKTMTVPSPMKVFIMYLIKRIFILLHSIWQMPTLMILQN